MRNGYVKLYEEFIDSDYDMQRIIQELEKRAKFWFKDGDLAKDAQLVDVKQTETSISTRKSLIIEFNDHDFYYQLILRVNIEEMGKCEVELKKYDPNSENETLELIDQLNLTGENKVDINDIKSDFVLDKIAELNGKSKNPDENDIEVPKDPEPKETPETPPTESPSSQGEPAQNPPAQNPPAL